MSKKLLDQTLLENLPGSLLTSSVVTKAAEAIDPELRAVTEGAGRPLLHARIAELSSRQLDHLAVQFDLNPWRDTWPVDVKRRIVRQMVPQKARVGTLSAVRAALASLGSASSVREWWQKTPKGEPHTFEVVATLPEVAGQLDAQTQEDLFALIDEAKPVRSHYTFTLATAMDAGICFGGAFGCASFARLTQDDRTVQLAAPRLALAVRLAAYWRVSA